MNPARLSPEEIAAIEWLAQQRSGRMSAAERQRFERWLAESERHRGAWERLQRRLDSAFAGVAEQPADLARNTLLSAGTSRRQALRGALVLAGLGLGGLGLTRPGMPLDGLVADLSTATGERRRFVLTDGSSVLLNAQSRVDVDFGGGRRRLQLRRGALLAEVTADARRPFVVETPSVTCRRWERASASRSANGTPRSGCRQRRSVWKPAPATAWYWRPTKAPVSTGTSASAWRGSARTSSPGRTAGWNSTTVLWTC
ncbi:FecR domain-containing protein [Azotobacter chroococcum]